MKILLWDNYSIQKKSTFQFENVDCLLIIVLLFPHPAEEGTVNVFKIIKNISLHGATCIEDDDDTQKLQN